MLRQLQRGPELAGRITAETDERHAEFFLRRKLRAGARPECERRRAVGDSFEESAARRTAGGFHARCEDRVTLTMKQATGAAWRRASPVRQAQGPEPVEGLPAGLSFGNMSFPQEVRTA